MRQPRRRPGRRPPTAAIAACVLMALGASAWLFATQRDDASSPASSSTHADEPASTGDEDVLELPDDAANADAEHRSTAGSSRLDPDTVLAPPDDDGSSDDEHAPAKGGSPLLAHLRGMQVSLAVASAPGPKEHHPAFVRIGSIRVQCAIDADAVRAAGQELLATEVARQLVEAKAEVVRADQPAACVDARSKIHQRAQLGIVIGDAESSQRVIAGIPSTGITPERTSVALATELAGWLGLDGPSRAGTAEARRHVLQVGAIDIRGRGALALVEVRPNDLAPSRVKALATAIIAALATAASRADATAGDQASASSTSPQG